MPNKITYIPNRVIDTNGIADGAFFHVYESGSTTPITIYADPAYLVPMPNPYEVEAGAAVPPIYYSYSGDIRVRVVEPSGEVISDDDPYGALFFQNPLWGMLDDGIWQATDSVLDDAEWTEPFTDIEEDGVFA